MTEAAFHSVLVAVTQNVADDALSASVQARLQHEWDNSPANGASLRVGRHVSVDKARELLFAPTEAEDSIGCYPSCIAAVSATLPIDHPIRAAQSAFLALLYLHHLRSWRLAVGFVRAGGLQALASLLRSPNLFIRTQAIEALLQITSHEGMNWFDPPVGEEERVLHSQLLSLGAAQEAWTRDAEVDPRDVEGGEEGGEVGLASGRDSLSRRLGHGFLPALCRNWDCGAPGASSNCLQILAFWLSWARKLYTNGEPLHLSRALLERLKEWADRPVGENPVPSLPATDSRDVTAHALAQLAQAPSIQYSSQQEAELAKQLYDDFSRFPAAEQVDPTTAGGSVQGLTSGGACAGVSAPTMATSPSAQPAQGMQAHDNETGGKRSSTSQGVHLSGSSDPVTAANACKEEGNTHFKGGRWAQASRSYSQGIRTLTGGSGQTESSAGKPGEGAGLSTSFGAPVVTHVLATLYSNRAASRLRMAGYGADVIPSPSFLRAAKAHLDILSTQGSASVLLGLICSSPVSSGAHVRHQLADAACDEDEGSTARSDRGGEITAQRAVLQTLPVEVRCLLGALYDSECTLLLSADHAKALMRRAQALASLHQFNDAAQAAKACLALPPGLKGSATAEVQSQAVKFLSFVTPLFSSSWSPPPPQQDAASPTTHQGHKADVHHHSTLEDDILAALLGQGNSTPAMPSTRRFAPGHLSVDDEGDEAPETGTQRRSPSLDELLLGDGPSSHRTGRKVENAAVHTGSLSAPPTSSDQQSESASAGTQQDSFLDDLDAEMGVGPKSRGGQVNLSSADMARVLGGGTRRAGAVSTGTGAKGTAATPAYLRHLI